MFASSLPKKDYDRILGMDRRISRRDYLNASLLGAGSCLLRALSPVNLMAQRGADDWDGFGGVGDYRDSHGDSWQVMADGHSLRDQKIFPNGASAIDTGETYDCVVVGGGISGLAAALFFQRQASSERTCLVLDIHPIFGGLAKRNEFMVGGQRVIANQASAMFFPPLPGTFLADFYQSIGIATWQFPYQAWAGKDREIPLGQTSYTTGGPHFGLWFGPRFGSQQGTWLTDPWGKKLEGAPIPEQARRELLSMRGVDPAKLHGLPKQHGDALSRRLDSITLEQDLMEQYGISRETVRTYVSPVAGGGSGIGADALSAYAEIAADVLLPWDYAKGAQMFPGGNAGVARHIVKSLIPDALKGKPTQTDVCRSAVNFRALDRPGQPCRVRQRSTVRSVRPEKQGVTIVYSQGGKLYRIKARTAIMAGGSWTTRHLIDDLPSAHGEAYSRFYRAPCLVANVALRNWRFLYQMGISEAQWFEGIGNYCAIRKLATFGDVSPTVSPDSPVVLTLKILYSYPGLSMADQVSKGRHEMLSKSFRDYEREIRSHFAALFAGTGFDPRRDIAGIILNRWGHAYLSAQPGFFFGEDGKLGPGDFLRNNPLDRIAFANSDLSGIMDHRASIQEAHRAVQQVLLRIPA